MTYLNTRGHSSEHNSRELYCTAQRDEKYNEANELPLMSHLINHSLALMRTLLRAIPDYSGLVDRRSFDTSKVR